MVQQIKLLQGEDHGNPAQRSFATGETGTLNTVVIELRAIFISKMRLPWSSVSPTCTAYTLQSSGSYIEAYFCWKKLSGVSVTLIELVL